MTNISYLDKVNQVSAELTAVLQGIEIRQVEAYLATLQQADKVFFVGVGRVLLALQTTAKRFNHLGIKSWVVGEINEPPIGLKDILVVGSGSGESLFPKHIAARAKQFGAGVVHLTSNPASSIAKMADVVVDFHCGSKAGTGAFQSIQPMTTLFEQALMIFGDLICLELMEMKGLSQTEVSRNHANLE
jgi:6-phospho-3-hexuloisomerase